MSTSESFKDVVSNITEIGKSWHSKKLVENARLNKEYVKKTVKDLDVFKKELFEKSIVVSAGPSLHNFNLLDRLKKKDINHPIICVDGSYVKCLKAGIIPFAELL